MEKAVDIGRCFDRFSETFSPMIIGELNGQYVLAVKCEGDKVPWHTHENEDEMFLVIEGTLDIFEPDKKVTVKAGEFYIVSRGVEHRVVPRALVKLLLFEPAGISHTGKVISEITKGKFEKLDV